jgi:hypothetical protein
MVKYKKFIKEYVRAINQGYAAVFAGAGLSKSSGFVDWKTLIAPLAEELSLDVSKENDLTTVAQYYCNEKSSRFEVNQQIINQLSSTCDIDNENLKIITRLPISTYWTTNYDHLIEDELKKSNRKADVKTTQNSLANNIYDRDAIVYKMHGDLCCPSEAVVIKDDYELYGQTRSLFRTALQGDLISKTFLFIGFSFEDPNLNYILSQIKILLGESNRTHYCFLKKIDESDYEGRDGHETYIYEKIKQELKINDLKRYGIQAVLVDSYDEITELLKTIEKRIKMKNIMISGSYAQLPEYWKDENRVEKFLTKLSNKLVTNDYKITTGFGINVGSPIINGALDVIFKSKYKHVDEHLCLRPFPQEVDGVSNRDRKQLWTNYREDMIDEVGIVIFLLGNKIDRNLGKVIMADGVLEEFKIAKDMDKVIIPIGIQNESIDAVGKIFAEVENDIQKYKYLENFITDLKGEKDIDSLIKLITQIIKNQQEGV